MSGNGKPTRFKTEGTNKDGGNKGKSWYYKKSYGGRRNTTRISNKYRRSDFQGGILELKVFYFDAMYTGQAEGFNKIKKDLLQYIERKNHTGPLVKQSLDLVQLMLEELPVAPTAE